jgi:hypothetical protein
MDGKLKGCHHCVGTAVGVTNLLFNFIHSKAIANGSLSPDDVMAIRDKLLESFSSGFDFFEKIHKECMEASGTEAASPFARDTILPSLLSACSKRTAKLVFKLQIENCGVKWLDDFYYGLANSIRKHVSTNTDAPLIAAFVDAAGKHKSALQISNLIQEQKVKEVLLECASILQDETKRRQLAPLLSYVVNEHIGTQWAESGGAAAKVATDEMQQFLSFLPFDVKFILTDRG